MCGGKKFLKKIPLKKFLTLNINSLSRRRQGKQGQVREVAAVSGKSATRADQDFQATIRLEDCNSSIDSESNMSVEAVRSKMSSGGTKQLKERKEGIPANCVNNTFREKVQTPLREETQQRLG